MLLTCIAHVLRAGSASSRQRLREGPALLSSLSASATEVKYFEEAVDVARDDLAGDATGAWDVRTEDGRGHGCSLEFVLRQHSANSRAAQHRLTGCAGERDTPFDLDGFIDGSGSLELTQCFMEAPFTVRYWRAEVSRDGRTMRGVWATDADGTGVGGATWKSSRSAEESRNWGLLTRRGRGVVEFTATRVDRADGEWSSDEDELGSGVASQTFRSVASPAGSAYSGRERGVRMRSASPPGRSPRAASPSRSSYAVDMPVSGYARGVPLLDMQRQGLLDERDGEAARAAKAEHQLYMLEQQLADVRIEMFRWRDVVLPEAEQRAVVAEEWRAYAERKQREAESFLLEAGEGKSDANAEAEEVAEELFEQQGKYGSNRPHNLISRHCFERLVVVAELLRRVKQDLVAERSSRVALETERDKAAWREASMEEALDSMAKQLAPANAGEGSGVSVATWRVAVGGATASLVVALVVALIGPWGCLMLMVFVSYPLLLGKALAPAGAFTQYLDDIATWARGSTAAATSLGDISAVSGWATGRHTAGMHGDVTSSHWETSQAGVTWPRTSSSRSQRRLSVASTCMSMSSPQ